MSVTSSHGKSCFLTIPRRVWWRLTVFGSLNSMGRWDTLEGMHGRECEWPTPRKTSETDPMSTITHIEGLCGGEPTIRGMRISVRDVVEYVELYGSTDRVLRALPDLSRSDIDAALDYYRRNRAEIARYRMEEDESDVSALGRPQRLSVGAPALVSE